MSQNVSKILPDAKMVKKDQKWPKKPKTYSNTLNEGGANNTKQLKQFTSTVFFKQKKKERVFLKHQKIIYN